MNRLLIVDGYDGTVGGAHRVAADIARAGLDDAAPDVGPEAGPEAGGWHTTVLLPGDGPAAHWLREHGVDVTVVPLSGRSTGGPLSAQLLAAATRLPGFWRRLAPELRRADLVHLHDLRGLLLGGPPALLLRRRVVWHVHSASRLPLAHRFAARVLLLARVPVVVPSRRGARSWAGTAAAAFTELPNSCELGPPAVEAATPLIVTVARRHPDKGLLQLLAAFGRVRLELPDARLRIVAPRQPGLERYDAELTRLAATPGVTLLDAVPDATAELAGAWVYCQPSLFEPFGLAALEASAAGVPVVATRVGGLPDVVLDGVTGRCVPPTVPALAEALIHLLGDPTARAALGAAGRRRCESQFSRAVFRQRLRELYGFQGRRAHADGVSDEPLRAARA